MSGSTSPADQYLDLVAQDLWLSREPARESLEELASHLDSLPARESLAFPVIVARMGDPQVLAQRINDAVGWRAWDLRWFALVCGLASVAAFAPVFLAAWATYPVRTPPAYGIELLGLLLGLATLWRVLRWTCQRSMPGAWTYAAACTPALQLLIGFQTSLWYELLRHHATALRVAWAFPRQSLQWDAIALFSGAVMLLTVVGFTAAVWERRQTRAKLV